MLYVQHASQIQQQTVAAGVRSTRVVHVEEDKARLPSGLRRRVRATRRRMLCTRGDERGHGPAMIEAMAGRRGRHGGRVRGDGAVVRARPRRALGSGDGLGGLSPIAGAQ